MSTKIATWFPLVPPAVPALLTAALFLSILPGSASGSGLELAVRPENSTLLYNSSGTAVLQIQILAPDGEPAPDRPPLNLSLVLDRSGSMGEQGKMDFVRQAAHMLVDRLGSEDILSIVAYNDRVQVPLSARRVTDRRAFHRAIDNLYPDSRTYLSGGMEEGFRQARGNRKKGRLSRVILLSDGLANVGTTDAGQLRRRADSMYESGVSLSTFGMGLDFDENLLAALASGGGGSYYYIDRPGNILAALKREFDMAASTVASGVEIVIRPMDGCRFESAPGRNFRLEGGAAVIGLGDLSAGETRTLMAQVKVPTARLGDRPVADVTVRYRDTVTGEVSDGKRVPVALSVVDDPSAHQNGYDARVQEKNAFTQSGVLVNEAAGKVDMGDRAGALSIIRRALGSLASAPPGPAVEAERARLKDYSEKIERLDDLDAQEVKEMQKGVKYRAYQELYQK